eukprot:gene8988-10610_t
MIVRYCVLSILVALVLSRTTKDDFSQLATKSGRILIGVIEGDLELVHLGINEGGNVNAVLEPYFGDMVLRLGKAYVTFPSCPALHLAFNYGTKSHLNVAAFLINYGTNPNTYKLPTVHANGSVDLFDRGYPPAILFALGMGQTPMNTHAALLQRMVRTNKQVFNFTTINQWRRESGNPPLVQLCLLLDNVDGAHVLLTEFDADVNEADEDGVTALHVTAWRDNVSGMVMLLRQGANPLLEDHLGRTPMHYVVMRGHSVVAIKILLASALASGAKKREIQVRMLTHTDQNNQSVIDLAAAAPSKMDLLDFLKEQAVLLNFTPTSSSQQPIAAVADGVSSAVQESGWFYPATHSENGSTSTILLSNSLRSSILSLEIDTVNAADLTPQQFVRNYFSAQRPALITGQLTAGAGVWAHRTKEDFLRRYGAMQARVGPGAYAEVRALRRYERIVATNGTLCNATDSSENTARKECNAAHYFSYRKLTTVSEYVAQCMGDRPANTPTNNDSNSALYCVWEGRAVASALPYSDLWRWDLPIPDLFGSLCRVPKTDDAHPSGKSSQTSLEPNWEGSASPAPQGVGRAARNTDEPVQIHLGGVHSGAPLQAHNASWHLLLAGQKKWFLLPPGALTDVAREHFVCNKSTSQAASTLSFDANALDHTAVVDKNYTTACVLTSQEWLIQAAPRLRERRQLVEVTQNPGDVLFIPHDWQYATLNLADTVAVSQEFCTMRHSDARIQPLGSVIYGRADPHRGLGLFKLHEKSNSRVGVKIKKPSKVPQFDLPPGT